MVSSEYNMAYFKLHFIPGVWQIISQFVCNVVPKFWHLSSSAEAAAVAADNVSIVNAFVTILFTLGCMGVQVPFCRLVNLNILSQANLRGSLLGPQSTILADTGTQYLVLWVFIYFICTSSLLVYSDLSDYNTLAGVSAELARTVTSLFK